MEYAIPLSSISAIDYETKSVTDGDQWKVNFQRTHRRLEKNDGNYQLEINPKTDQPYKVDFAVWSPQGLRNIHYLEMWGIIQFSEQVAGENKVQFKTDSAEENRWTLRLIYYQMKEFYLNHGYFTNNRSDLDLSGISLEEASISIEATPSLFEVSLFIDDDTVHIAQDGRVWKD